MYRRKFSMIAGLLIALVLLPLSGNASVKLEGYFIAEKNCEAVHSIKKGTHPFTLTKGMAYKVIAKNKPEASHYRISIESLEKKADKWVSVDCGLFLSDCKINQAEKLAEEKNHLLAISWQPAFCQTNRSKVECATQTKERYDATHLVLHGLWPQPKNNTYCNVSAKEKKLDRKKYWDQLAPLNLSDETFSELLIVMPGVGSYLQRHEWIKHGSCYSNSAEIYYRDSLHLLNTINDTKISRLFADNVEKRITAEQIRDAFDEAFGEGSGNKVNVKCKNGLIVELWVNLRGDISSDDNLSILLQNAPAVNNISCEGGIVDAVGF